MKQGTLPLLQGTRKTSKQVLLEQMEQVVPWDALVELIAPCYTEGRTRGPPFYLQIMQQCLALGYILDVGGCFDDSVHHGGTSVHTCVRHHAIVPLVSLLELMYIGGTSTGLLIVGTGGANVVHCTGLKQRAVSCQPGVNDLQYLEAQVVHFEQVPIAQDADPVRNSFAATAAFKFKLKTGLEYGFCGPQVRVIKLCCMQ